jgi:hypothetical protein
MECSRASSSGGISGRKLRGGAGTESFSNFFFEERFFFVGVGIVAKTRARWAKLERYSKLRQR